MPGKNCVFHRTYGKNVKEEEDSIESIEYLEVC